VSPVEAQPENAGKDADYAEMVKETDATTPKMSSSEHAYDTRLANGHCNILIQNCCM